MLFGGKFAVLRKQSDVQLAGLMLGLFSGLAPIIDYGRWLLADAFMFFGAKIVC